MPASEVVASSSALSSEGKTGITHRKDDALTPSSKEDRCIVTYKKERYDVTNFVEKHPGGRDVIVQYSGRDMTEAFDEVGHSATASKLLMKYKMDKSEKEMAAEERREKAKARDDEINKLYGLKFTTKKLFTEEDKFLVHKVLGVAALASFAYRYFWVWPTTGTLGFDGSWFDYFTLSVHFLLSFSSLIFHVLEKRITQNPLIIYEEYRQHAIVFTLNTTLVALVGMGHYAHQWYDAKWLRVLLLATFVGCRILVDDITARHGTPGVTAVRNKQEQSLKSFRYFFSFYQLVVTGCSLIPHARHGDFGFNALIAIQSSAVLMTLKRKSLIGWYTYVIWYTAALFLSEAYMFYVQGWRLFAAVGLCFYLRSKFDMNKYALWGMYAYVAHFAMGL
eukprot:GDKI01012694.1.p1 GENE.GDKI01012694.1~~GDKI01012694.1.p1  ORF type:complete len:405 (+),score=131.70 GDKI01012694.1:42-1217(+)